jgi:hypothetical protein
MATFTSTIASHSSPDQKKMESLTQSLSLTFTASIQRRVELLFPSLGSNPSLPNATYPWITHTTPTLLIVVGLLVTQSSTTTRPTPASPPVTATAASSFAHH